MVGMKDCGYSFNPLNDYFIIFRTFEGLYKIVSKDYACKILDSDEGLCTFLHPFEGLFYYSSCVTFREGLHAFLQPLEGLFYCPS